MLPWLGKIEILGFNFFFFFCQNERSMGKGMVLSNKHYHIPEKHYFLIRIIASLNLNLTDVDYPTLIVLIKKVS